MRSSGLLVVVVAGVAVLHVVASSETPEESPWSLKSTLESFVGWVEQQGPMGPVYYTGFLAVWIALLLPPSILEILPGFMYGWTMGFVVSLSGKVLGSLLSLVVCRLLFKTRLLNFLMTRYPKFKVINQAVQEEGLGILIGVRMSYLPLVLKNYGLASIDVSWMNYMISAVVAGIPFSMLWSFIGASSQNMQSILEGKTKLMDHLPENHAQVVGIGAVIVIVFAAVAKQLWDLKQKISLKFKELEGDENDQKRNGGTETTEEMNAETSFTYKRGVLLVLVVIGGGLYWMNRHRLPSLKEVMTDSVDWIRGQGDFYGPLYYMIFLALWVTALLPCSILEMVPGFLFGFRIGVVVSIIGKNIGTVFSLLLGRYLLKDMMQESLLKKYPYLVALEKAVKQEGFPVLIMIRCAYLPMLIKNYGLSCLDINLFDTWVASLFASFPFAALWTFIGASATNLGDIMDGKLSARDFLPGDMLLVGSVGAISLGGFGYAFYSFQKRFREIMREIENEKKTK